MSKTQGNVAAGPHPEKNRLSIVWELAAPQDHPQNVYEQFVFLVSRILFLLPSPKLLKLGVSPEPGEPATSV